MQQNARRTSFSQLTEEGGIAYHAAATQADL
jgi:hypothetical protein